MNAFISVLELDPTVRVSAASILLVDSDKSSSSRLSRGLMLHGYRVRVATGLGEATMRFATELPDILITDTRLPDGNGLDLIIELKRRKPNARALVITAHGSIANAVAAIKCGAIDYLTKPCDAEEIEGALTGRTILRRTEHESLMSADRVRWEHINRVYEACERNVSETARSLGMHRRTLQRILSKRAPK